MLHLFGGGLAVFKAHGGNAQGRVAGEQGIVAGDILLLSPPEIAFHGGERGEIRQRIHTGGNAVAQHGLPFGIGGNGEEGIAALTAEFGGDALRGLADTAGFGAEDHITVGMDIDKAGAEGQTGAVHGLRGLTRGIHHDLAVLDGDISDAGRRAGTVNDGDVFEKVFHWGSQNKPSFRSRILEPEEIKWAYTDKPYDENNSFPAISVPALKQFSEQFHELFPIIDLEFYLKLPYALPEKYYSWRF